MEESNFLLLLVLFFVGIVVAAFLNGVFDSLLPIRKEFEKGSDEWKEDLCNEYRVEHETEIPWLSRVVKCAFFLDSLLVLWLASCTVAGLTLGLNYGQCEYVWLGIAAASGLLVVLAWESRGLSQGKHDLVRDFGDILLWIVKMLRRLL